MSLKFLWIVFGIFVSFFLYATLQEKLVKSTYGDGEKFTYIMPLLFVNAMVGFGYALFMRSVNPYTVDKPIPILLRLAAGLLTILAMTSSIMALQWVSYPAQVLAKSCKPIPVMFMGILLGDKSYPIRKYCIVFLIVFGVATFFYNSDKAAASSNNGIGIGEVLLLLSLLMDGLLNSLQERLMSKYKPHPNYLMLDSNKWSILLTLLMTVSSGEGVKFVSFVQRYPDTILLILGSAILFSFGQFFIFKGITELGTLTVSIITTSRKFFTVLFSIILFGHHISLRQWIAIVCVFTGLILDTYFSKGSKKAVTK